MRERRDAPYRNGSRRRMVLRGKSGQSRPDRALPMHLRLRAIGDKLPTSSIDELWVFPPLPDREIACEFIVLVCFDGGDDRRRILTSHVDAHFNDPEADQVEWVQRVREHGAAPVRWLAQMPERLLQRLADAGIPEVVEVGGRTQAWEEAIQRFTVGSENGVDGPEANGRRASAQLIDKSYQREISFSTIIEFPNHPADRTLTEPDS